MVGQNRDRIKSAWENQTKFFKKPGLSTDSCTEYALIDNSMPVLSRMPDMEWRIQTHNSNNTMWYIKRYRYFQVGFGNHLRLSLR